MILHLVLAKPVVSGGVETIRAVKALVAAGVPLDAAKHAVDALISPQMLLVREADPAALLAELEAAGFRGTVDDR